MKFDNNKDRYKVKKIINNNLIKFLESKKLLNVFIDRVIESEYNKELLKTNDFKIPSISSAFIWSATIEGDVYWDKLNREYFKL